MTIDTATATRFPELEVSGTPREMGREIGEAMRETLHGLIDHVLFRLNEGRSVRLTLEQAYSEAGRYMSYAESYAPEAVQEIRGVAEGADLAAEAIMLINARGEVGHSLPPGEGCTSVAINPEATKNGVSMVGQNWDNDPGMRPFSFVLTRRPQNGPAFMTWGQPGLVAYIGLSDAGFGVCMNAIAGPSTTWGVPWYFSVRRVYESRSFDDAVEAINGCDRARPGNLAMMTPEGAADIETQIEGIRVLRSDSQGRLVHTNHCNHPDLKENNSAYASDLYGQTYERETRASELLDQLPRPYSVDTLKTILSDHRGEPTSICRHPNDDPKIGWQRSVVSVVLEPAQGRMHVSRGNPCEARYETYLLN